MKRFLPWFMASVLALASTAAMATFHTFQIERIYSNAAGTLQYVVLRESKSSNGENLFAGQSLSVTHNGQVSSFEFPNNLPNRLTANKRVLIGTAGLATFGLITPDYVIPDGFIPLTNGKVDFADVDAVDYGALPTNGSDALNHDRSVSQNLATNYAGASVSVPVSPVVPEPVANYEGLWWNAPGGSESGWGINFAHQGDIIFATWFTYDLAGKPWWLAIEAHRTAPGVYAGDLFTTTGPAFNAQPFLPANVTETTVGTATFTFSGSNSATFAYTVNGVAQTKSITRQLFATPVPICTWDAQPNLALAANYQDLWWKAPGGTESGWGINFTHQGDIVFATWFTYDLAGKPWWLALEAHRSGPMTYAGDLFTTTGPAFNAEPFLPANVKETTMGTATLTFADGNAAAFAYKLNGVEQTKPITRQVFAGAGTSCK